MSLAKILFAESSKALHFTNTQLSYVEFSTFEKHNIFRQYSQLAVGVIYVLHKITAILFI